MLFTIIIIAWLVMALFRGFHRGLVIEILNLVGTIGVLIFARLFYQPVGQALSSFLTGVHLVETGVMTTLIINVVAFFILTSIGWAVVRFVARLSRKVTWLPVIKQVNSLAGGIVAVVVAYLVIFVCLTVANLINTPYVQAQMTASPLATYIVKQTPVLTSDYLNNWIQTS